MEQKAEAPILLLQILSLFNRNQDGDLSGHHLFPHYVRCDLLNNQ